MAKIFDRLFKQSAVIESNTAEIAELRKRLDDATTEDFLNEMSKAAKASEMNPSGNHVGNYGSIQQDLDIATLQRLLVSEGWFYICVSAIAETIAALPIKIEKRKVTTETVEVSGVPSSVSKESWVDASGEPEHQLFLYPNDLMTAVEFWTLVYMDLFGTGNSYIYVDQGDVPATEVMGRKFLTKGPIGPQKIHGMYRMSSAVIQPIPSRDGLYIEGYGLQTAKGYFRFSTDEIIHIKLPNPVDPFLGLAPIVPVFKNILLDRFSTEHMIRFYKAGARLGGVIKTPQKLSKDQLTRLQRSFDQDFTGKQNHHKTLILPQGMDYQTIEQNPGETSLMEFQKGNREPIMSAYKVPPIKVGLLDGASYANAFVQLKLFYSGPIKNGTPFIEQAINQHKALLPSERQLRFRYDFSQVEALQENELEATNAAKGMLEGGMTVNEVRQKKWKLGKIEGGDVSPVIEKLKAPAAPAFSMPTPPAPGPKGSPAAEDKKESPQNAQVDSVMIASDVKPTEGSFESRVSELVAQAMAQGFNAAQAVQWAMEKARLEGFTPQAVSDQVIPAQVDAPPAKDLASDQTIPTAVGTAPIKDCACDSECPGQGDCEKCSKGDDCPRSRKKKDRKHPFSEDAVTAHWKALSEEGVVNFMAAREKEAIELMSKLEKAFMDKYVKNLRRHGIFWRIKSDDDMISSQWLKEFITREGKEPTQAMKDAMAYGYENTRLEVKVSAPNEQAIENLRKYAAAKLVQVTDTVKSDVRDILTSDAEEMQVPGATATALREYFGERRTPAGVSTIVRTETLAAVSLGQAEKVNEFKKEQPKAAQTLQKTWITARDDRVRDSHADLEGEVVGIDEAFSNGLKYPRDAVGEAEDVIGCRCTWMQFMPEDRADIEGILDLASDVDTAEGKGLGKGGPGSGCHGPNCGRPSTGGSSAGSGESGHEYDIPNASGTTSKAQHMIVRDGKEVYAPKRAQMHKEVVHSILKRAPQGEPPVAIITAGGSGSGKSSVLKKEMPEVESSMAKLDADKMKEHIPEYVQMTAKNDPTAATFVHEESSDMVKAALKTAIDQKKNFVYDNTFSNIDKAKGLISQLKSNGYEVHLVYVDLPVSEAIKRAEERGKTSGRYVPRDVINKAHEGAISALRSVYKLPDSTTIYSNSGTSPELLYRRVGGQTLHRNESGLAELMARGHADYKSLINQVEQGEMTDPNTKKAPEDGAHAINTDGLIEKFWSAFERATIPAELEDVDFPEIPDECVDPSEYPNDLSDEEPEGKI